MAYTESDRRYYQTHKEECAKRTKKLKQKPEYKEKARKYSLNAYYRNIDKYKAEAKTPRKKAIK